MGLVTPLIQYCMVIPSRMVMPYLSSVFYRAQVPSTFVSRCLSTPDCVSLNVKLLIQNVLYHLLQDSKTFPLARVHQYTSPNDPPAARSSKQKTAAVFSRSYDSRLESLQESRISMNSRQREGLKVLNKLYRTYCINSLTLGNTQSGADRHLETKVLGTSSRKD